MPMLQEQIFSGKCLFPHCPHLVSYFSPRYIEFQCIQYQFYPYFVPASRKRASNVGILALFQKILKIAPLKCLEMLSNCPIMWQLADNHLITRTHDNDLNRESTLCRTLCLPQITKFIIYSPPLLCLQISNATFW